MSFLLLILIIVSLIAPCVLVWSATYYLCLKAESKFDENGKVIRSNDKNRRDEKRFTGKVKATSSILKKGKKMFSSFLFDYDKKKKKDDKAQVGLTKSALN